jgi:hypothetical protein
LISFFFLTVLARCIRFTLDGPVSNSALLIGAIAVFLIGGYLYYLTKKAELSRLYGIGTLGSIFALFPFIDFNFTSNIERYKTLAIFILTFFTLGYALFPLFQPSLLKKNMVSLGIGQVIATLFVALEIYQYGHTYLSTAHL